MNRNNLTVTVLKQQQQLAGTKGRFVCGVGLMLGNTIVEPSTRVCGVRGSF